MPDSFRTTRLVEFHDTDMAGIMHFASFFHYMESVEHEFIRSLGFSVHSLIEGDTLSFPRVSVSCDFQSPARCEEILDVELRVLRIGAKSVTYSTKFSHQGRPVATGQITCACCRIEPGKPLLAVPIPEVIAAKLKPFLAE
ncbi:MAG: acyl-CoA thioesterase [Pirellulales bacterium]|nr:acyl-CoA thioesterase [Pirellulales bacterium]